jgi:hypothetical protein
MSLLAKGDFANSLLYEGKFLHGLSEKLPEVPQSSAISIGLMHPSQLALSLLIRST